jgi:hypothetical protein
MRIIIIKILFLFLLTVSSWAQPLALSFPTAFEVKGNGLQALAFVVGVSEEAQTNLNFSFAGFPLNNPPTFDQESRLFFWCPEPDQIGKHIFKLTVAGPNNKFTRNISVNVVKAAPLEPLPNGWKQMKDHERYLEGQKYFPSTNFIEASIAALPDYEIEVTVKDSRGADCVITYVPGEGREEISKSRRTVKVKLGAKYRSGDIMVVKRNLYEDLFAYLGLVFKKIEAVKVSGKYLLKNFSLLTQNMLVSSFGIQKIYMPQVNFSIDDRFYNWSLNSKENPILISDAPTIVVEFNTASGLNWRKTRLVIDDTEYLAAGDGFSKIVVKPYSDASTFDVNYAMFMLRIPNAKKLPFGEHVMLFDTENAFGIPISREVFARVVTLPSEILGRPLTYPNPFNPERDKKVEIQYQLSIPTNIEIIIFGSDGTTKMRRKIVMGEEGARKGYNKVPWDGKTAFGAAVSNGIYTGIIIDQNENRVLGRFRMTVYR